MKQIEYIGWIKETKSGKYRGVISSLHETGDDDGDRLLFKQAESEIYLGLKQAQSDLQMQCDMSRIERVYLEPIKAYEHAIGLYESAFPKETV